MAVVHVTNKPMNMKIKIDNKELVDRLQIVQNLISHRATLPILSNYLLEADGKTGKLWITSTDLEVGVRSCIDAQVEEGGAITLPAKKLGEILHGFPTNGDPFGVTMELKENNRVQVLVSKARFQMAGIPRDDYPVLPEFQEESAIQFSAAALSDMIQKTIFAVSSDEARYMLNGAMFFLSSGTVALVATDGRRLAAVRTEGFAADKSFKAIVPSKALVEISRIIGHFDPQMTSDQKILIDVSENRLGFRLGETTLFSRLIEGNFPNWEQVIPRKAGVCVKVNRENFLAVTKRASVCITDRVGTCRYKFFKNQCHVASKTLGHYEFEEEMDVLNYEGEEGLEVAFTPAHLVDFLKNINSQVVEIYITTAVNPVLFVSPDNPNYSYVVMPTRVQQN